MKAESAMHPRTNPLSAGASVTRSPHFLTGCHLLGLFAAVLLLGYPVFVCAQEAARPAGTIQVAFLPPPLEHATYSLGIFDAKTNKLVRHLQEFAPEKDFTVGLNGLTTTWDGKDDAGTPVPAGRYAARGYAVGALKIEGVDILGNDWAADDENLRIKRVDAVALLPGDAGLAVLGLLADDTLVVARYSSGGKLLWHHVAGAASADGKPWLLVDGGSVAVLPTRALPDGKMVDALAAYRVEDGTTVVPTAAVAETAAALPALPPDAHWVVPSTSAGSSPPISAPELSMRSGVHDSSRPVLGSVPPVADPRVQQSAGKDGSLWTAAGALGLVQTAADRSVLRKLEVAPGEPVPLAVSASTSQDRLYLLEERHGWQRVRGLAWVQTREEAGHPVSTWQTFFERNVRAPEPPPVDGGSPAVEINLDENPLSPGKSQKIRVVAAFDSRGSYLATEGGLRLRRVSERPNLERAYLTKGKPPSPLDFFQYDGAATDEFFISGVHRIMEFDAGEIEMTAAGEKPVETRATEPPDL